MKRLFYDSKKAIVSTLSNSETILKECPSSSRNKYDDVTFNLLTNLKEKDIIKLSDMISDLFKEVYVDNNIGIEYIFLKNHKILLKSIIDKKISIGNFEEISDMIQNIIKNANFEFYDEYKNSKEIQELAVKYSDERVTHEEIINRYFDEQLISNFEYLLNTIFVNLLRQNIPDGFSLTGNYDNHNFVLPKKISKNINSELEVDFNYSMNYLFQAIDKSPLNQDNKNIFKNKIRQHTDDFKEGVGYDYFLYTLYILSKKVYDLFDPNEIYDPAIYSLYVGFANLINVINKKIK
jgi:hypothetical protein